MSWSTPRVWSVGEELTAANMNTYISNDLSYLYGLQVVSRKTTSKAVNNTIVATDLLNGEITIAAGALGTAGVATLTASGDWKQNSGGTEGEPVLQLQLGGTTVLQTVSAASVSNNVGRQGWWVEIIIRALGVTNSQSVEMRGQWGAAAVSGITAGTFATGEGVCYCPVVSTPGLIFYEGWNTAAKDDTAALTLALNVINGIANTNYETKLYSASLIIN